MIRCSGPPPRSGCLCNRQLGRILWLLWVMTPRKRGPSGASAAGSVSRRPVAAPLLAAAISGNSGPYRSEDRARKACQNLPLWENSKAPRYATVFYMQAASFTSTPDGYKRLHPVRPVLALIDLLPVLQLNRKSSSWNFGRSSLAVCASSLKHANRPNCHFSNEITKSGS